MLLLQKSQGRKLHNGKTSITTNAKQHGYSKSLHYGLATLVEFTQNVPRNSKSGPFLFCLHSRKSPGFEKSVNKHVRAKNLIEFLSTFWLNSGLLTLYFQSWGISWGPDFDWVLVYLQIKFCKCSRPIRTRHAVTSVVNLTIFKRPDKAFATSGTCNSLHWRTNSNAYFHVYLQNSELCGPAILTL